MITKVKQRMEESDPYFVHIGYTFACEGMRYYQKLRKRKDQLRKGWYKPPKLKMRPVVKARQDKLQKYWDMALK